MYVFGALHSTMLLCCEWQCSDPHTQVFAALETRACR